MTPKRLAILAGGWSGEREVSLNSGAQCQAALEQAGHEVILIDPSREQTRLARLAPDLDAVLIMLHGPFGEDGRIQGFLDCLGLPYQGAGVASSALAIDKVWSKERFRQAGLRLARDVVLCAGESYEAGPILTELGGEVVVKPARQGSTLGISLVSDPKDLQAALETAFELDEKVLIEERLRGTEITGSVLETLEGEAVALPVIEIRPKSGDFFDYRAKYTPGASDEICPAPLPDEITAQAQAAALAAHKALQVDHWSRTDMFVVQGRVYVLEINTIPGMASTSLFPQAAAAAGLPMPALLERLVGLALRDRGRG